MRKIVLLILSLGLILTCLIGCAIKKPDAVAANDQTGAVDQTEEPIEEETTYPPIVYLGKDDDKVYSKATLEDNFSDDIVLVVMKNNESLKFKDYTIEDFPNVNIKAVDNLTYETGMMVKAKMEGKDIVMEDGTVYRYDHSISPANYRHIIALTLEKAGKENVLEAISILAEQENIMYAGPDFIATMELKR